MIIVNVIFEKTVGYILYWDIYFIGIILYWLLCTVLLFYYHTLIINTNNHIFVNCYSFCYSLLLKTITIHDQYPYESYESFIVSNA